MVDFDEAVTEHIQTEGAERKRSLRDLLDIARTADSVEDFEIDLAELGMDLRTKIDHIVEYIDYCESRSTRLQARANEFEKRANSLRNQIKSLKSYVANTMALDAQLRAAEGIIEDKPKLTGHIFEFQLFYSEAVEPKTEASADIYLKVGPKFMRRSYAWDKVALKNALKDNSPLVSTYAMLKQAPHISIKPR